MTHQLYEDISFSNIYVKYRPSYSVKLFETIISYCEEGGTGRGLAVDLGCGSGQATSQLSRFFKKVIGVDISQAQIANAPQIYPNVSYMVGAAEDLEFLEDGSVDLVTIATALHWMDTDKLYGTIKRILKPDGVFAVWGYGIGYFNGSQNATNWISSVSLSAYKMKCSCQLPLTRSKMGLH